MKDVADKDVEVICTVVFEAADIDDVGSGAQLAEKLLDGLLAQLRSDDAKAAREQVGDIKRLAAKRKKNAAVRRQTKRGKVFYEMGIGLVSVKADVVLVPAL